MQRIGALWLAVLLAATACERVREPAKSHVGAPPADSMGREASAIASVPIRGHAELVESSAAAMSTAQSGVWFTVNDSGHEPVLFAFDTSGAPRGRWLVLGARNSDWESASYGLCGLAESAPRDASDRCVYIGDTGDNEATARSRSIYRVREPKARADGDTRGSVSATRLTYRYLDGPHDVEAIYVAPDAAIYLITKRPITDPAGRARPALVYRLAADAWTARGVQQAQLVDSLPIIPGSAFARFVTDAALSPNAQYLAVRTYTQVFVFATDPATGRVRTNTPPAVCNVAPLHEDQGEGVAWTADSQHLLLTSEGRTAPFHIVGCPLP
jgi:hypothetical protein